MLGGSLIPNSFHSLCLENYTPFLTVVVDLESYVMDMLEFTRGSYHWTL